MALDRSLIAGVSITSMQFVHTKGGGGTLNVVAHIQDRKHVLEWEAALRSEPLFSGVSVPTADLIKNEDSEVRLTFTVLPLSATSTAQ